MVVKTIAVCPGAGSDVLSSVTADVYFTGEMKHHDILAALEKGTTIILGEHSRTERGYLPILKRKLTAALGNGIRVLIATSDHEPITFVRG